VEHNLELELKLAQVQALEQVAASPLDRPLSSED